MSSESSSDILLSARHIGGTNIHLHFADNLTATIDLAPLGLDASELRLPSIRAASSGDAVEVKNERRKTTPPCCVLIATRNTPLNYGKPLPNRPTTLLIKNRGKKNGAG